MKEIRQTVKEVAKEMKRLGITGHINIQRLSPPFNHQGPTYHDGTLTYMVINLHQESDANLLKISSDLHQLYNNIIYQICPIKEPSDNAQNKH